MTDDFKIKLKACELILDHAMHNPSQNILHIYPTLKNIDVKKYIINIYNVNIPNWLIYCIGVCCGIHKYFAPQMFCEIINSINSRKFNMEGVPQDYVITPEDWIECYEDGYPICTSDGGGCYEEYKDTYNVFIDQITEYLKNSSMN